MDNNNIRISYTNFDGDSMMTYNQTDYNTLKQLLRKSTNDQNAEINTSLSPNGTFKYIDRESEKYIQRKYSGYVKPQLITRDRIRRPLNCFMVFSHLERKRVAEENPELHNADLSKILGKKWKNLNPTARQPYIDEAERIRVLHTEIYPDYKYQPRRKGQSKRLPRKIESIAQPDKSTTSHDFQAVSTNDVYASTKVSSHGTEKENKKIFPLDGNSTLENKKDSPQDDAQMNGNEFLPRDKAQSDTIENYSQFDTIQVGHDINPQRSVQDPNLHYNNYPVYQQITPDLSPTSCYKEPAYTTPVNSGMNGMQQSFPPTPEISPTQINRDESVFNFDSTCFSSGYFDQQINKPYIQNPQINEINNPIQTKDLLTNYNYFTQGNNSSQINQFIQDYQQHNILQPEFYQQHPYNGRNYLAIPNRITSQDQLGRDFPNYNEQY